jgi:hypothetical protein
MGAVVLPLFTLFGEEALEYRMHNAEASADRHRLQPAAQSAGRCAIGCRISRRSS